MIKFSRHLIFLLFATMTLPAFASQDGNSVINVPPPYIPPPSAPAPSSPDSKVNEHAGTSEPQQPDVLDRIMQTYPDKIDIKPENRSDLSTCNATESEAMLIALYNCWPLLEGFQAYHQAKKISRDHRLARQALARENPDYQGSEAYKADQEAEYEEAIRSAQQIEYLAGKREYPMQDMLLFLADIVQISVAQKRKDYKAALTHFDHSIMIFETTQITEPDFANLAVLKKQRARMARRMERQNK